MQKQRKITAVKSKKIHNIRTFKTDTAETIKAGNVTLGGIYMKQKTKRPLVGLREQSRKIFTKNFFLVLGIILTLFVGGYFFIYKRPQSIPGPAQPPQSILINQDQITLQLNNKFDFERKFQTQLNIMHSAGNLIYLPIQIHSDRFLNAVEFLNYIETAPPVFLSTFLEENFMLGILNLERNHPLLIFKIRQKEYSSVFAGMLKWEDNLIKDLNFILDKDKITSIAMPDFSDKIIRNQTTRIAVDEKNGIVFIYSIFNKRYIIITDSVNSFEKILEQFIIYNPS